MASRPRKHSAETMGAIGFASARSVVLAVIVLVAMGVGLFYEEQAAQRDLQREMAISRGADGGLHAIRSSGGEAPRAAD